VPHGLRYARCGLPGAVTTHSWSDYWGFWRASSVVLGCAVGAVQGRSSVGGYHRGFTSELWWWGLVLFRVWVYAIRVITRKYGKRKEKSTCQEERRKGGNKCVV
jgi:hypothetical protein